MDKYRQRALENIARELRFSDLQLDLVGRCLTLTKDSNLVSYVQVEYTRTSERIGGPILEVKGPREIDISIALQPSLKKEDHDKIMNMIRTALEKIGVNTRGQNSLVSYSERSYGIEREDIGIDIHFGFSYPKKVDVVSVVS